MLRKLGIVVLACAALLLAYVNLFGTPPPRLHASADPGTPYAKALTTLDAKCTHCHAAGTPLPLYAALPGVKPLIARDVARGLEALDLLEALPARSARPVPEVTLAKLEFVAQSGEMPPARYRALHWGTGLSSADRDAVVAWTRSERARLYATPGVPEARKTDVLQPLPQAPELDAAKVALGRQLFHDVRLSGDDTLSCASCHALDKGGTDRARYSTGIRGQLGGINAPTVFNAADQVRQFWDGRALDLTEQAHGPVHNPMEMGSNWEQVIGKLSKDKELVKAFTAAYPSGLKGENIADAIATFERSLVTPNSAFDRYLRGDEKALSAQEKRGYALFLSKGCASCHVGRLLGGQSFERMGRTRDYFGDRGHPTDADNGRFSVTKREADRHRFKVPTLRNVALTAPYLHDGSAADLKQAVVAMGKYQLETPLADGEADDVVSFLGTLTGEYAGNPLR